MSDIYLRPRWILDLFSRRHHDAWKQVDALRARRKDFGNWPDWCFLPLALVQTIVANGRPVLSPEEHKFVALLGVWLLGGQRRGSTVLTLRLSMPSGKLRLLAKFQPRCFTTCPSGCVYIPTPDKTWRGNCLNGFFASPRVRSGQEPNQLHLLLDVSRGDDNHEAVALSDPYGHGRNRRKLGRYATSARRESTHRH